MVQEDRRDAVSHERGYAFEVALDRADKKAVDTMLFEYAEIALLVLGRFVARTEYDDVVPLVQHVLDAADHLSEERVGDIEEHDPDRAALADPQLMGGGAAYKACGADRVENPAASGRGHDRRVVEHVGHCAKRYPGERRHFTYGDPLFENAGSRSGDRASALWAPAWRTGPGLWELAGGLWFAAARLDEPWFGRRGLVVTFVL